MKLNTLLLISTLLILAGCTHYPQQSQSQIEGNILRNTVSYSLTKMENCVERLHKLPEVQMLDKEVFFYKDTSPYKFALLASNEKINELQSKALVAYLSQVSQCREDALSNLNSYPNVASSVRAYARNLDMMVTDLLSKKISIGDANKQKVRLLGTFEDNFKTAVNGYINSYSSYTNAQPAQSSGGGGGVILVAPTNNPINLAPFMTNPSSAIVRGNTQPFQQPAPQLPIQNPSVNCNPNGVGGFRCQ